MAVNKDVIKAYLLYEYKLGTNVAKPNQKTCLVFQNYAETKCNFQWFYRVFWWSNLLLKVTPSSEALTALNKNNLKSSNEIISQTC